MSKTARVLDILTEGPATSYEVGVEMGTDTQRASALLHHLKRSGVVTCDKAVIKRDMGRRANLWRIAA